MSLIHRRLLSTASQSDFTHCVIGGGVIGLAVASRLSARGPTVLLERHPMCGIETSSRNSEVIHAGIYYPPDSLKTKLCIRGKEMMYETCEKYGIPHKRIGKWIVAQDEVERKTLEELYEHCGKVGVKMEWIGEKEAKEKEPEVQAKGGVLSSPTTGIVSAHELMMYLHGVFLDNSGDTSICSDVIGLSKSSKNGGYEITVANHESLFMDAPTITSDIVINAAGLNAVNISNMLLPEDRKLIAYYAKGSYFSYSGKLGVKRLIYPAPVKNLGGLGTHLTLDTAGRVKFGPDVEWVDNPKNISPSEERLDEAVDAVARFIPGIDKEAFEPEYSGIRPKLAYKTYHDFVIRQEEGFPGFINLLGIESPGLTSSLAIAEMVDEILYK